MTILSIVDYGVGNIRSVINAVEHLGATAQVVSEPAALKTSHKLLLPGVGSFRMAAERMWASGFGDALLNRVQHDKVPLLGICVGMQLLAERGTEDGGAGGLGLVPGVIDHFDPQVMKAQNKKVPHVGFNTINPTLNSRLFAGLGDVLDVYFTHSFRLGAGQNNQTVAATCTHGETFVAAVENENVVGTQFHPEKSQANGLAILQNFMRNY